METDQSTIDEALQRVETKQENNEACHCSLNNNNCIEDQATTFFNKINNKRFTVDFRKHQEEDSVFVRIKEIVSSNNFLSPENKKLETEKV